MRDSVLAMVAEAQTSGWTDERVEILKKLWMDGLSASQIAGELGQGVTRNAVIGKVHRLKLSARAKPTNSTPRSRPAARTAPRRVASPSSSGSMGGGMAGKQRTVSSMRTQSVGATALAADAEYETERYVAPAVQEIFIPEDKRLSLLQLNEETCKWPIGDPLTKDFYFCGQHSDEGKPYCEFHSRRAYHQIDKKRR
ncbi:GcrA family cell cycle regulator [Devosia rhodophyticola]|uniref:GcrA family cell cycle regulator n=1 Tax=Devosia rhodophyticola TaxID=3026423 RepID=A0ABY7Z056_9HYPH|nr:GcrA family cell cycle regulator [Devosia rhodophyticola]WDR07010.1 GcrA family cell cycle regulator [Devosia rhodophyticola]